METILLLFCLAFIMLTLGVILMYVYPTKNNAKRKNGMRKASRIFITAANVIYFVVLICTSLKI